MLLENWQPYCLGLNVLMAPVYAWGCQLHAKLNGHP